MVAKAKTPFITPQEYLERERRAETKNEYHNGVITAMAAASRQHTRITTDLLRHLGNQLEGRPCEPFPSDMRVRVPACNRYFYPDASVVCGEAEFEDKGLDTLLNPSLIVEVLSDTTQKMDQGEKKVCYFTLASLSTYVLIAQHKPQVEIYRRMEDGDWRYSILSGMDAVLKLPAIVCEVKLADIYAHVEFPEEEPDIVE